jgi:hypothetical protein
MAAKISGRVRIGAWSAPKKIAACTISEYIAFSVCYMLAFVRRPFTLVGSESRWQLLQTS